MHRLVFTFQVGVLAATVALGSCSFILVDPAPPLYQWPANNERGGRHQYCTRLPLPSILDAVVAAGIGAATVYSVESTPRNSDGLPPQMIGILAVPFVVGAFYGWAATATCRAYLAGPPYPPVDSGR